MMAGHVRRPIPAVVESGANLIRTRNGSTCSRSTASTTTTRCGQSATSWAWRRPSIPFQGRRHAHLALERGVQSHRTLRRGGRGDMQGAVPGRSDAALSKIEVRLPGGRRGMGLRALQRPHRSLEKAQPQGAGGHRPCQSQPRSAGSTVSAPRRQGAGRQAGALEKSRAKRIRRGPPIPARRWTTSRPARSNAPKRFAISSFPTSISAAKRTIRPTPGPSIPSRIRTARGSTRSSDPISAISTCPT